MGYATRGEQLSNCHYLTAAVLDLSIRPVPDAGYPLRGLEASGTPEVPLARRALLRLLLRPFLSVSLPGRLLPKVHVVVGSFSLSQCPAIGGSSGMCLGTWDVKQAVYLTGIAQMTAIPGPGDVAGWPFVVFYGRAAPR